MEDLPQKKEAAREYAQAILSAEEDLSDSIAEEDARLPVPGWKRDELRQRKERFLQHAASGRTWEQIKHQARAAWAR